MKIVLINNHSILNSGDFAILLQTLHLLHNTFPQAEIVLTFNEPYTARSALPTYRIYSAPPSWGTRLDQNRQTRKLPRLIRAGYLVALLMSAWTARWRGKPIRIFWDDEKQALLEELATADIVIACGGGYIYHWFTFASALIYASLIMNRPLVMLPQSIGPFHHPLQEKMARFILRRAKLIFTRETISWQQVRNMGISTVTCEPDLAFGFPSASHELAQEWLQNRLPHNLANSMYVGITVIDWQKQNRRFSGQERYERELVQFIDRLTAQEAVVVLFAQTCGPSREEDDRYVNMRIMQMVRDPQRVIAINDHLHPSLLQALYGCMDYFIATRLHSFIFATNAGIPAINIGYLSKSEGVLRDMGLLDRWIDIEQFDSEKLWRVFTLLQQEGMRATAQQYVLNSHKSRQKLHDILLAHFGSSAIKTESA